MHALLAFALAVLFLPATASAAEDVPAAAPAVQVITIVVAVMAIAVNIIQGIYAKLGRDRYKELELVRERDREVDLAPFMKAVSDLRAELHSGHRLDAAGLMARCRVVLDAQDPTAARRFVEALANEMARSECGGCAATRQELVRANADARADLAQMNAQLQNMLERTLTSADDTCKELRELAAAYRGGPHP